MLRKSHHVLAQAVIVLWHIGWLAFWIATCESNLAAFLNGAIWAWSTIQWLRALEVRRARQIMRYERFVRLAALGIAGSILMMMMRKRG